MTNGEVRFRPAALADAGAVTALVNERELLDRGVIEATVAAARAQWTTPGIELGADGLVGELGGRVVYAALASRDREYVYVATDHEGRGLGSRLLGDGSQRRARRRPPPADRRPGQRRGGDAAAARGLRARPLVLSGWGWRLRARKRPRRATPQTAPSGSDRSTSKATRASSIGSTRSAFAANPDYEPETFEQFCDEHLRSIDGDPRAILAATDGGRIVGFLLGARRRAGEVGHVSLLGVDPAARRVGHVSLLGVDPAARRRGVAMLLLLRHAFELWRTDGLERAELTVASDNAGAGRLYRRLGMEVAYTLDCYQRPLVGRRTSAYVSAGTRFALD